MVTTHKTHRRICGLCDNGAKQEFRIELMGAEDLELGGALIDSRLVTH